MMRQRIYYSLLFLFAFAVFAPALSLPETKKPTPLKKELTEAQRRKFDYFFYEGVNLKNAEKYDAAYDVFNHCLAIDSTAAPLLFELSSFYMQLNRSEKALELLKQAVAYSENNFTYRMALATLTRGLGMYSDAAEEFELLVKDYPGKAELHYYLAEALTQQGEIAQAIEAFNALESITGMNETLSMQKYKLFNMLEQPVEAFHEIEKLAAKYPMEPRYQIILGDLRLEKGELDKALEHYTKAKAIDPENPYYIVSMANYFEAKGDKEAAEIQINDALVNDKLDVDVKVSVLSRYIYKLGLTGEGKERATNLFKTLLEQHPEDTELKMMYASLLATQQKYDEAKFQYQLVTEMEPDNIGAWQQLLSLSMQTENMDELISVCTRALELFPDASEYYFYLGIAYYQQKDFEKALETYKEGIEIIPAENIGMKSNFYGQIGDIYYQMDQRKEAFEAYEEALKYNDKNVVVLNNYSYFLSLAKEDLKRAERMSAQCIKVEPDNATYLDTYAWVFFMQGNYSLAKIYIERALDKDTTDSPELFDHHGDILFMTGEQEKALEQWKKAKEMGKESPILDRKISEGVYIEDKNAK